MIHDSLYQFRHAGWSDTYLLGRGFQLDRLLYQSIVVAEAVPGGGSRFRLAVNHTGKAQGNRAARWDQRSSLIENPQPDRACGSAGLPVPNAGSNPILLAEFRLAGVFNGVLVG